jgi:energy-coupling factor transporter transmembrane protein EcfT
MTPEEDQKQKIIFEQYKLYVEMADRISQRRAQTNQFYLTILSALVVILSFIVSNHLYAKILNLVIVVVGVVGILLCIIWYYNIESYKQLNSGKFKVIHEMEAALPFAAYKREWEILGKGKKRKIYFPITHIEKYLPLIMVGLYVLLIICSIHTTLTPDQVSSCIANCTLQK